MARLTKAQKEQFNVRPVDYGLWAADCPHCGMTYRATDTSVTQLAVVYDVLAHIAKEHNDP